MNTRTDQNAKSQRKGVLIGRIVEVAQILLPGIYAWSVTVVPSATLKGSPGWATATALCAFVCLVTGAMVSAEHPRLARGLGIWGFVGLSLVTWLSYPQALRVDRIDAVNAAVGAFGWTLYGLGWGRPWRPGAHPEDHPRAQLFPKLEPRKNPMVRMALTVAAAAVAAIATLMIAWRTTDSSRAVMTHAAALAVAIGMVTSAARVALVQGQKRSQAQPRQRLSYAFPWLMALGALGVLALAYMLVRT